ncbi:MAG TPA: hypothetical protein VK174_06930, partial [Chitinophagales bacterium]|nr:hypothetical protein [Chitinophagales bacterium]
AESVFQKQNSSFAEPVRVRFVGRVMVTDTAPAERFTQKDFSQLSRFSIGEKGEHAFLAAISAPPANLAQNSLMITDVKVVEDPTRTWNYCTQKGTATGPWTFGTLMREMASANPASIATDAEVSKFVLAWLAKWDTDQTINGDVVGARTKMKTDVTDVWLAKSEAAGSPKGQLDMKFAPFRLLAIVNRVDLRGNVGYGSTNAGEGRFVFCLINPNCNAEQFTVIFEYGINKKGCSAVKAWGQQWYNLASLALGSTAYNDALQKITDQFSKCGTNTAKPNQSSLNQLRTNEIALANPWQLREFNVLGNPGQLQEVTVKQEPDDKYNGHLATSTAADVEVLAKYVNTNQAAIINNTNKVPEMIGANHFLGGAAHTQFPPSGTPPNVHHWNGTTGAGAGFINSNDARFNFSLNTCSGCHGGETQTFFTQIKPAGFGTAAPLAGFLTGISVTDAATRPSSPQRPFNDLLRRAQDLEKLVNTRCKGIFGIRDILTFKPLNMEH